MASNADRLMARCLRNYGWRRGVVVSGVRRMNEVNARRARLVPVDVLKTPLITIWGGLVAGWLACWTQAQKGPGSNRSGDAVG